MPQLDPVGNGGKGSALRCFGGIDRGNPIQRLLGRWGFMLFPTVKTRQARDARPSVGLEIVRKDLRQVVNRAGGDPPGRRLPE